MTNKRFDVTLPVMPGKLRESRKTRTEKIEETHEVNGKVFHTIHFRHIGDALPLVEDFAFRIKARGEEIVKNPAAGNERIAAAMDKRGMIDFRNADLRGVDFSGAYLGHARFDGADLRGADFRGADLNRAIFAGADLREADFRGADCVRVDMEGANLALADFSNAVNVSCVKFGDTADLSLTILPDFKAIQAQSVAKLRSVGLPGVADCVAARTVFPGRSNTAF